MKCRRANKSHNLKISLWWICIHVCFLYASVYGYSFMNNLLIISKIKNRNKKSKIRNPFKSIYMRQPGLVFLKTTFFILYNYILYSRRVCFAYLFAMTCSYQSQWDQNQPQTPTKPTHPLKPLIAYQQFPISLTCESFKRIPSFHFLRKCYIKMWWTENATN